jgi:transposase
MAKPLLPKALWDRIAHLFPPRSPQPKGGRPWLSDRQCLTGIIFVLRSGIPWSLLPREMGCGSGVTCWRRLREWQAQGIWDRIHCYLLDELGYAGQIDWSRAIIDSASSRAVFGGPTRGRIPPTAPHGASTGT